MGISGYTPPIYAFLHYIGALRYMVKMGISGKYPSGANFFVWVWMPTAMHIYGHVMDKFIF